MDILNHTLCDTLNENGRHVLMCLNGSSLVSGSVWEGLGGVALLEVCHQGWTLRFQKPMPGPVYLSLSLSLTVDHTAKLSASRLCSAMLLVTMVIN